MTSNGTVVFAGSEQLVKVKGSKFNVSYQPALGFFRWGLCWPFRRWAAPFSGGESGLPRLPPIRNYQSVTGAFSFSLLPVSSIGQIRITPLLSVMRGIEERKHNLICSLPFSVIVHERSRPCIIHIQIPRQRFATSTDVPSPFVHCNPRARRNKF